MQQQPSRLVYGQYSSQKLQNTPPTPRFAAPQQLQPYDPRSIHFLRRKPVPPPSSDAVLARPGTSASALYAPHPARAAPASPAHSRNPSGSEHQFSVAAIGPNGTIYYRPAVGDERPRATPAYIASHPASYIASQPAAYTAAPPTTYGPSLLPAVYPQANSTYTPTNPQTAYRGAAPPAAYTTAPALATPHASPQPAPYGPEPTLAQRFPPSPPTSPSELDASPAVARPALSTRDHEKEQAMQDDAVRDPARDLGPDPARDPGPDPGRTTPRALATLFPAPLRPASRRRSSLTDPRYLPKPPTIQQVPPTPTTRSRPRDPPTDDSYLSPNLSRRHSLEKLRPIDSPMMLQVPIPTYRLGRPHITDRGTVYLHDSIYSASSGASSYRSSTHSNLHLDSVFPVPPASKTLSIATLSAAASPPGISLDVDPSIYNAFIDDAEETKYIRYLPGGRILAATPARLVAQITHVRFLDYELLSDFFLTFRPFMTTTDLLRFLIARLRWALCAGEAGRVVRVRTFVAVRHWILNYFMDDFEPDLEIRTLFCDQVNRLAHELAAREDRGGGDLQVVGELKKCWRRTSAIVWDTGEVASFSIQDDIVPDGLQNDTAPNTGDAAPNNNSTPGYYDQANVGRLQRMPSFAPVDLASIVTSPAAPFGYRQWSVHADSCSIPVLNRIPRTVPSFRPRSIMAPKHSGQVPDSSIVKLPSVVRRHKKSKSKGSKSSIDTVVLDSSHREESIVFDPKSDIGPFPSGDLIRGIVLAPPLPRFAQQVRVPQDAPPEDPIERDEKGNVLDAVKRKLTNRSHSRADSGSSNGSRPTSKNQRTKLPDKSAIVSRFDVLAARVAASYEKLVREGQGSKPAKSDVPAQTPSHGSSASTGSANVHKDLPPAPRGGLDRMASHMTTSSRSITIINDTANDDPPAQSSLGNASNLPVGLYEGDFQSRAANASSIAPSSAALQAVLAFPNGEPIRRDFVSGPDFQSGQPSMLLSAQGLLVSPILGHGQASNAISAASYRSDSPTRGLGLGLSLYGDGSILNAGRDSSAAQTLAPSRYVDPSVNNQLRRMPGGDLRAANSVDDLARPKLRRHSTGSTALVDISRSSSDVLSNEIVEAQVAAKLSHPRIVTNHSDAKNSSAKAAKKHSLKLLSTHSSAPNLRASFQADAKRLAAIPNELDLDGGVESTLAKLEGRPPTSPRSPVSPEFPPGTVHQLTGSPVSSIEPLVVIPRPRQSSLSQIVRLSDPRAISEMLLEDRPKILSPVAEQTFPLTLQDELASEQGQVSAPPQHFSSIAEGATQPVSPADTEDGQWSGIVAPTPRRSDSYHDKNWPLVNNMDIALNQARASTRMSSSTPKGSFFLEDGESLSGDSDDDDNKTEKNRNSRGGRSFLFDEADGNEGAESQARTFITFEPPTSPPPTSPLPAIPFAPPPLYDPMPVKAATRLRTPGPDAHEQDRYFNPETLDDKTALAKPFVENYSANTTPPLSEPSSMTPRTDLDTTSVIQFDPTRTLQPTHTPFILSFSSEVLATQFTVIERDALAEVDWKELVELRWMANPPPVHNWAEYMKSASQSGVDIVIARFNLCVRWAVSEILLTTDMHDRARTVSKLIRIAVSARQLRNYATMYQLTAALLSTAVSRLSKTWTLVPQAEKDALAALESVVQPARNFARLRHEMEAALLAPGLAQSSSFGGPKAGEGGAEDVFVRVREGACVPFMGVYTHDLAANAGKPAFVDDAAVPTDDKVAMVNFERFQTAAGIVKGLLRLLEASAKYAVRPNRDMIARCLWLAALDEGEIEVRSRGLESGL